MGCQGSLRPFANGAHMLIQKLRVQRGWSQEQLAELSGLSVRTIQRLERGQTASVESLKALASVFEIDFALLKEPDMTTPQIPGEDLPTDEALALAHVRRKRSLYIQFGWYVAIMAFLAVVNAVTYVGYVWVIWPALGWGIGLIGQAMKVFDIAPFFGGEWERREVEKVLGRKL